MQRQHLMLQIQYKGNTSPYKYRIKDNISHYKYKSNISIYKYRMQRQYINQQIKNEKTISQLTNTECKACISPYKYKMQRQ